MALTKWIEHKVSYEKPSREIRENSFADSNMHCTTAILFTWNNRYLLQRPGHIAYLDLVCLPSSICVTLIAYFNIRIFSKSSVVKKSKSASCLPLSRFSKREIWPRQLVDFSHGIFVRSIDCYRCFSLPRPDIAPKWCLSSGLRSSCSWIL